MQCFPNGAPRNSRFPRSENFGFAINPNYNVKCCITIIHEQSVLELQQIQLKHKNLLYYFQLYISA